MDADHRGTLRPGTPCSQDLGGAQVDGPREDRALRGLGRPKRFRGPAAARFWALLAVACGVWQGMATVVAAPGEEQAAVALPAEAGDTADAQRDYLAYIAALRAGDKEAARPYVYEDWQLEATVVEGESIRSAHRNGDKVVFVLDGKFAGFGTSDGSQLVVVGTARMVHEGDRWKVRARRWDISPTTDPVAEAMAWLASAER
jgi:hypothetical protein